MTQNQNSTSTPVTVIGLGLMGQALAQTFLRAGHPTTVWNRSPEKAEALVAEGAKLADSVGGAVTASPLVVICVTDYVAMRGLLEPLGAALAGRVIVNLTSGTSEGARETAAWVTGLGGTYLDGAIMAIPQAVGTADAVFLYSGPKEAFDLHQTTLRSLGPAAINLGTDPGLSSLYDVAMLGMMWSVLNGFLQGAALLTAAGVDATAFAPLAQQLATTVADWIPGHAQQVDDGAYPAPEATINTHLGSMDHLISESESAGVNAELPRFIKALADRAVADGRGGEGYAALIEQFRKS